MTPHLMSAGTSASSRRCGIRRAKQKQAGLLAQSYIIITQLEGQIIELQAQLREALAMRLASDEVAVTSCAGDDLDSIMEIFIAGLPANEFPSEGVTVLEVAPMAACTLGTADSSSSAPATLSPGKGRGLLVVMDAPCPSGQISCVSGCPGALITKTFSGNAEVAISLVSDDGCGLSEAVADHVALRPAIGSVGALASACSELAAIQLTGDLVGARCTFGKLQLYPLACAFRSDRSPIDCALVSFILWTLREFLARVGSCEREDHTVTLAATVEAIIDIIIDTAKQFAGIGRGCAPGG